MSNSYLQFSEEFEVNMTDAAKEWLRTAVNEPISCDAEVDEVDETHPGRYNAPWRDSENEGLIPFAVDIGDNSVIIYCDESGSVDHAVHFMQEFWKLFGKGDETGSFEWASYCSSPIPGSFGGGTVVFNATKALWMSSTQDVSTLLKKLAREKSGKTRFRRVWNVVTDFEGCDTEVSSYTTREMALKAAADVAVDALISCRDFGAEEQVEIKALYAAHQYSTLLRRWQEISGEGECSDMITIRKGKVYTHLKEKP